MIRSSPATATAPMPQGSRGGLRRQHLRSTRRFPLAARRGSAGQLPAAVCAKVWERVLPNLRQSDAARGSGARRAARSNALSIYSEKRDSTLSRQIRTLREPHGLRHPTLCSLQFRARASDAALHARDGHWCDGSALRTASAESRLLAREAPPRCRARACGLVSDGSSRSHLISAHCWRRQLHDGKFRRGLDSSLSVQERGRMRQRIKLSTFAQRGASKLRCANQTEPRWSGGITKSWRFLYPWRRSATQFKLRHSRSEIQTLITSPRSVQSGAWSALRRTVRNVVRYGTRI